MDLHHKCGKVICDEPGCKLHDHHHEHHHSEKTCDDPNCTLHHHDHHHGHDGHEALIEDSLIMSCTRSFKLEQPELPDSLREKGMRTFLHLGEMMAFEGVVVGHIKGIITAGGRSIAFSLTRTGAVDITELAGWGNPEPISSYDMTVNIMSLIHAEITEEDIFALMI